MEEHYGGRQVDLQGAVVRGRARGGDAHLRQVQSAVVVAVAALKQQNCELDADIATVLQRSVADRLHEQIERLEALMRMTAGVSR